MALVGRTYSSGNYRYGFNGKENDKDISEGAQDYGLRINDVRLGRFLSVDPLTQKYPELTPYQFAGNIPIWAIDLDGGEPQGATTTVPVIPEVGPASVRVPTSTPQSQGGLSNSRVGPGGIVQNGNSRSLPASSGQLDAPIRYLTTDEINNLIPPYCQGFSINPDNISARITGANGSSWNVSLLKPPSPKRDPQVAKGMAAQAFITNIGLSNPAAKIAGSTEDFKQEQPGVEYFYRAMSLTEFSKTGGFIQSRGDGRNDYPFITPNLGYLLNEKSFIWRPQQAGKYDMIVRYGVPSGTKNYLESASEPHGLNVNTRALLSNSPVKKTEAYTIFGGITIPNTNYGFPGQSGSIHFNPKIVTMTVAPINQ